MTEAEVFEQLKPLIVEVTGVGAEEIQMGSVLMTDLGAESLDLLDLSFLIEDKFGIRLEGNEFESQARKRLPGIAYEKDGFITDEALRELRVAIPEIDSKKLTAPLRKFELPSLLNVAVFVHLIQRKLSEKGKEIANV